jgi:YVTN family beta-propeller protein
VIEAPNKKIYVTNSGDGTVSVYQGADLQQIGRIDVGGTPHGLRSAADGSVIVIADPVKGTVELIDPGTDQVTGSIAVGSGPAQVAVSSDGPGAAIPDPR